MQVRFDLDYDGYPWPGPLENRRAAYGELWAGQQGFLGLLETQTGLAGPAVPEAVRAAALVPAVRETAGFWSRSAEVDPMGVAGTLLRWRDLLWAAGWRGQSFSARLKDLARLRDAVVPGFPDRMEKLAGCLAGIKTDVKRVELTESRSHYSHAWKSVFERLEKAGSLIVEVKTVMAQPTGDLLAAQKEKFAPIGDGGIQLLRSQGPQAAAEAVAAWLARFDDRTVSVVIAADPLLDAAFRRHGLPTTGASAGSRGTSLVEILPLVLQMGWLPPDPARALELLTLATGPVPYGIRYRLVEALKQWPAVGSEDWNEALAEGLEQIEDAKDRKRVAKRLKILLTPTVSGVEYPAAELQKRTLTLMKWLEGMLSAKASDADAFQAAIVQCSHFLRLLQLVQLDALTKPQLQRMLNDATSIVSTPPRFAAEAGLHSISGPGALGGAAERVIWWNFTRDSSQKPDSMPLTAAEKAALADEGISLPEPAEMALRMNARWCRPLQFARSSIMFVCPKYGSDGEPQHPHPLWDQIAANASDTRSLAKIIVEQPLFCSLPRYKKHNLRAMPKPKTQWQLDKGKAIAARETESPSGAGSLVGCPFQWTLNYMGKIRGGETAELPADEQLMGTLAHEILARVLKANPSTPLEAQAAAEAIFDKEGPLMAAVLFMPGTSKLREQSRRATARAAFALTGHLKNAGMSVIAVETSYEGKAFGATFTGRTDLVVGPPKVVIDLKWSGERYRKTELEAGAAYQLASYSHLVGETRQFAPTAFFIISTQVLLTTHVGLFKDALVVAGAGPDEVWTAFEQSYEDRRRELRRGLVMAPGERDVNGKLTPEKSELFDGRLRLMPPCHYCEYGLLCGHGLEIDAAVASAKGGT
jgi:ATP-dependent helicase/nuclease subunit B